MVVGLTQLSREAAKKLRDGRLSGAATTDGGAESAQIERAAYLTLAVGNERDGTEPGEVTFDISVGKDRFGPGGRVQPVAYHGASGLFRIVGPADPGGRHRHLAKREERRAKHEEREATKEADSQRVLLAAVRVACTGDGTCSAAQLAEATVLEPTTAGRRLKRFIRNGYFKTGGAKKPAVVTPKGRALNTGEAE